MDGVCVCGEADAWGQWQLATKDGGMEIEGA